LIFAVLFLINPVSAAINTIRPGEMVFIGEQGLDVTLAMEGDSQVGWWASGAGIGSSSPDGMVSVSSPASLSISPSLFGSKTGVWYHLDPAGKSNGTAFTVADPQLGIIVEDSTVNVDVTDKWVPTGDELRFRIDTNLYPISGRTGVSSTPVSIKVQSPDGSSYSSLISKSGVATSIVDYAVTTTPQYTGSIWGTSNRDSYPPGTYTIWAECNVNGMKDNYDVTGKTISRKVSLLNQDMNPLIVNKAYVTNPTTPITIVPTRVVTSIATPAPTTLETSLPSTAVTTVAPMTTAETVMPMMTNVTEMPTSPPPTQKKSPGFEAPIVVAAMVIGLAFSCKKQ
jgi:hypothetical protein